MSLTPEELLTALEALVDTASLREVLGALAEMCEAKAEHEATDWQDQVLSRVWARAAAKVYKASQQVDV